MKEYGWKMAVAAFALAAAGSDAAEWPAPDPRVPAEIVAMLKEHLGKWHTEGEWISNGKAQPTKATWECRAAVGGIGNICTWNHEWADRAPDSALEIIGYDPERKTLRGMRVTDGGVISTAATTVQGNTMIGHWESVEGGKKSVGHNEIVVKTPGEWVQHMTIDVDGKRVTEMNVTHHRVN